MLMTQSEVAAMLQVSIRTIWLWRKQGMPYIKINTAVRFEKEDVMEWVKSKGE